MLFPILPYGEFESWLWQELLTIMTVGYIGPEHIRGVVEHVLANRNIHVMPLSAGIAGVVVIILAIPLRQKILAKIKSLHPQAQLIAIAKGTRRHAKDIVVLGFKEVWKIRQYMQITQPPAKLS